MEWRGEQIFGAIEDAVQEQLLRCAADLQSKSSEQAPIDKGDLRGNCAIDEQALTVRVGYSVPYALRQHEELDYQHPKGGKAKYLEDPFNENAEKYGKSIEKAVGRAIR